MLLLATAAVSIPTPATSPTLATNPRPFACPICFFSFKRREHLSRHYLRHLHLTPFQCRECKKRFTRKDELQRHERMHWRRKWEGLKEEEKQGISGLLLLSQGNPSCHPNSSSSSCICIHTSWSD